MNPLRLLHDPITTKELSGISRRWQTYAARGLYVALFGITVWSYSTELKHQLDAPFTQSALANLGQKVLDVFLPLQTALIILTAISSASDLVTKEVRAGTLGLLVCTPLSPWQVALGKWKAATAQSLTLLLCGAPILAVCSSIGALPPRDVACVLVLSAAGAALGAALSLYCSSLFRSGTTALLTATVLFFVFLFLPMVLFDVSSMGSVTFMLLAQVDLLFAFFGSLTRPPRPDLQNSWIPAAAVTMGLALLFVRLTAARVATLTVRTPTPPLATRVFEALDRFYEGLGPEKIRHLRFFAGRGEVWDDGAILWKELRTRASGRLRNSVRIAVVLLLVLAFAVHLELRQLWIPAFASTVLLWFLSLANGASLFVTEKEERKWDILLATPLRSSQILAAKLLAGTVPVAPMAATILCFWTLLYGVGFLQTRDVFAIAVAVVLPAVLIYLLGAACSLKARSLRAAFILALTLVTGMVLVVPWIHREASTPDLYRYRYSGENIQAYWLDPLRMLEAVCRHGRGGGYFYDDYSSGSLAENAIKMSLTYLLLGGGIIAYMYLRFNRIAGRSE